MDAGYSVFNFLETLRDSFVGHIFGITTHK